MFFAGKKLFEGNTLQDYSIQKDSTLHLVKKPNLPKEYNIEIENSINGIFKVNTEKELNGNSVFIDIIPNEGYELDKIIVLDTDNKEIDTIDNTFVMPKVM